MQQLILAGLAVSILICFALPIVPLVLMQKRGLKIGRPFLVGVGAFIVSQVVHIPVLSAIATFPFYKALSSNIVLYGLYLGLMAGLCEEFARFFACKLLLKKNRRYPDALAYGFGHGGCEAVVLAGISLIASFVMYIAMTQGALERLVGPIQAAQLKPQFESLTPLTALAGGIERISAVGVHVGLSVMVFTGFAKGKPWLYLLFAILCHAAVDAVAVIAPGHVGIWGLEGIVALMAALLVFFAVRARKSFTVPKEPEPEETMVEGAR